MVNTTWNCHCIPTYLHPFQESVFLATDKVANLDFMSPPATWLQMQLLPWRPDTTWCQATLLILNKRQRDGVSWGELSCKASWDRNQNGHYGKLVWYEQRGAEKSWVQAKLGCWGADKCADSPFKAEGGTLVAKLPALISVTNCPSFPIRTPV